MEPIKAEDRFAAAVPKVAFATDCLADGLYKQSRIAALGSRYIQPNARQLVRYLVLDVDKPGAHFAARDAILPSPTWIAENRENGHAHLAYELASPVATSDISRMAPVRFLAAIERGLIRRLAADPAYAGLITKNPLHPHWRTEWGLWAPYQLKELADWLHAEDMRLFTGVVEASGLGRNCNLFDDCSSATVAISLISPTTFYRSGLPETSSSPRRSRSRRFVQQSDRSPNGHGSILTMVVIPEFKPIGGGRVA